MIDCRVKPGNDQGSGSALMQINRTGMNNIHAYILFSAASAAWRIDVANDHINVSWFGSKAEAFPCVCRHRHGWADRTVCR